MIFQQVMSTNDGSFTVRHPEYDETFHSTLGAFREADALYMQASGFAGRLQQDFSRDWQILDVGLGLGYNALRTLELFLASPHPGTLHLLSLEKSPELLTMLAAPETAWKQNWSPLWQSLSQSLQKQSEEEWLSLYQDDQTGKAFTWRVLVGDAQKQDMSTWCFDFIWQDAFSPGKNPELWTEHWFAQLRQSAHPDTCLVSYSVARAVRDSLTQSGWQVKKLKTKNFLPPDLLAKGKREWLSASPSA